ncbi:MULTISPECIES: alpha-2-macroglobulin [Kordiimonas]|uniref:alpha-2-macroglobulin n=1 Tax=Kordiimonas TaxID=288021 RepID=UPI00257EE650|nr:alpha-2-macroglobulin [Kordiimonas sp. UBA4487]
MRSIVALILFTAICFTAAPAPTFGADLTGITAPTVLKDRSADAERLLEDAQARAKELEAYEAAQNVDGLNLSDAFKEDMPDILPETDIKAFRKRHRIELRLAKFHSRPYAWRDAAEAWMNAGRPEDAYGAAWRLLDMAKSERERAAALDVYVRILLAERKPEEALTTLREAQAIHRDNPRQTWLNTIEGRFTLRVVDQLIDVEGRTPRACLVLSHPILDPLPIELKDYIRFDSPRDIAVRGEGDRICLTGMTYGDTFGITLLAGLPGHDGAKLYDDARRSFTVPDREARVMFGNGTYILPRVGDETVPLKSVNVETASLGLLRVPDGGIVPWMKSGLEGQNLNEWAQRNLGNDLGERVWEGTVDIDSVKNQEVTTLVPIRDILETVKPGIYALVAAPKSDEKRQRWVRWQTQWLVISDLGVLSLQGADGMHVFVNSLESAKPVRNATVRVIARNNDTLGVATTDRQGQATIATELLRGTGGNTPMALTVSTDEGDYNFIKLQGAALDLSDRGTEGRYATGPLDAFLYAERGIYRPGGTARLSGMLRDQAARAVPDLPLSLVITRPDGVEALRERVTGDSLGTYALDYSLSPAARTGQWRVTLYADDEKRSVGSTHFQVDDFVPERLTAKLETTGDQLTEGTPLEVHVQADFLYGAPGANLEGTLYASLEPDPTPFPDWKEYQFGLAQDEFTQEKLTQMFFKTGEDGLARVALTTERLPQTTLPLRAKLTAEVQDVGGRSVQDGKWLPVSRAPVMLGVRADGRGHFEASEDAGLTVVAVDADGKPLKGRKLTAVWVKEHYNYTWYQSRGRWQYRTTHYDETLGEEELTSGEDGTVHVSRLLPWGRYRLEVMDEAGNAASSRRFYVGWWMSSQNPDVPDGLELTVEETALESGDRLRGFVKAPFEGVAILTIANDQVRETKTIELGKDGTKFDFKVKADWGPSAYVLATAIRPNAGAISRLPVRATGLAWFSVDKQKRSRRIVIDVPETALPSRPVTIPIKLDGPRPEGPVKVTVAAVDEGILNITRYKAPNPNDFYFGKRAFGFDVRDIYGRLIRSEEGKRGTIRTGGDGRQDVMVTGSRLQTEDGNLFSPITHTTKAVSLMARDIELDEKGEASVTFELPDFMGSLRLMAVATAKDAVGTGSANLTVRTPVVADLITPRFLAPGDASRATFTIQNLSGKDGGFTVSLAASSPVISLQAPETHVTLKDGERRDIVVPLKGLTVGDAGIALSVTGAGLPEVSRHYDISVRPAWPYVTQRARMALAPGETSPVEAIDLAGFYSGTVSQYMTVSSRPNLEAGRLFEELRSYPYRCSEQTVSRALPSLYFSELNKLYGLSLNEGEAANAIENAVMVLLDRQRQDGSFGLWGSHGSTYDWLDAYVTDFLLRAKGRGYYVPDGAITLAFGRLKGMVARRGRGLLEATAYAHYILARHGEVSASEVRYFTDQFGKKLRTPLASAQLAGALSTVGETEKAEEFFVRAIRGHRPNHSVHGDYGSRLRDVAALTTILAETGTNATHMAKLAEELEASVAKDQWLSTQEKAWLARAAASYAADGSSATIFEINGEQTKVTHGFWRKMLAADAGMSAAHVSNTGDLPIRVVHTLRGVSKQAPEKSANGFAYSRTFYDLDGAPISPDTLPRNGRFVVLLSGTVKAEAVRDPLLVDLLPAGLEIESTDTSSVSFLKNLTRTAFADARDDRFVAAIEVPSYQRGKGRSFQVAYIVRAITPGTYVMPGPFVEDMYKSEFRYQGAASSLEVTD